MFGDPLLIRSGRAYERTVRGDSLLRELQSLLPRLESMVRGEEFDPKRSQERFRLAVRHHASITLIPPLIRRIRSEAPGVRLEVTEWEGRATAYSRYRSSSPDRRAFYARPISL